MKKIIIPNRNLQTKVNAFETRVLGSAGGVIIDKNRMLKTCVDFEDATILFTPNGFRATRLQNVIPDTAGGDFTFSRNSQAGIINSAGAYEMVANNVPRLDWRTGVPALLNENQSTNLCFPSDVAVTQNISTLLDQNIPYQLHFIGTGSVTVSGSGTGTLNGTGASTRVFLNVPCATGTAALTVTGDVREIQFERGFFATSYIPTLGSAVTRLAENTRIPSISGLLGQTSGAIYAEFQVSQNVPNFNNASKTIALIDFNSSTSFYGFGLFNSGLGNQLLVMFRNSGGGITTLNSGASAPLMPIGSYKVILKYENLTTGIQSKIFINGNLAQTVSSVQAITTTVNGFRLGGESAFISGFNDRIFKAAHWNYALTDAKCERLTRII